MLAAPPFPAKKFLPVIRLRISNRIAPPIPIPPPNPNPPPLLPRRSSMSELIPWSCHSMFLFSILKMQFAPRIAYPELEDDHRRNWYSGRQEIPSLVIGRGAAVAVFLLAG